MKVVKRKCSYADEYKAIRKPACGCSVCLDKWKEVNKEK